MTTTTARQPPGTRSGPPDVPTLVLYGDHDFAYLESPEHVRRSIDDFFRR